MSRNFICGFFAAPSSSEDGIHRKRASSADIDEQEDETKENAVDEVQPALAKLGLPQQEEVFID